MKEQSANRKFTRQMLLRTLVVGLAIFSAFAFVFVNLFVLQIKNHEFYRAKAAEQQLRDTKITPNRGTIYDKNMKVLAKSATVWSVTIAPSDLVDEQKDTIAEGLSQILEIEKSFIQEKMAKKNYYELIKAKVDKPKSDEVRQFYLDNKLKGIHLVQDSKRYYPFGDFAATVLGFTGAENQGLSGLEAYYDKILTGVAGRTISAKNAKGNDMDVGYESVEFDPKNGNSIVLTIDEVIQHYLEKNLSIAVEEHNVAQKGVGIVMDINTGAILAMATKGDYDPNNPFEIADPAVAEAIAALPEQEQNDAKILAREAQWRNKAVSDLYEPGSVFKIVTAAAALDSGVANLNSGYSCSGNMVIAGTTMRCANTAGHGRLSFGGALMNSCNPSFMQIGAQLGKDRFYDYFNSFGLTQKTGIDISGEATGIFYTPNKIGPVELASISFGQSSKLTPIQMITAASTALNGGFLVQPHFVSKILDDKGNIIKNLTPETKRQVISSEVSKQLQEILEETVTVGPGKNAYVPGYRVAGKSGTSQKLDTGDLDLRIASFFALAPANNPQIAILIILDEPNSYSPHGGVISAPVAKAIITETMPYLGLDPVYNEKERENLEVSTPSLITKSVVEAQSELNKRGFIAEIVGDGGTVLSQFPSAYQVLPRGSKIILNTTQEVVTQEVSVPSVLGKSKTSAAKILASAGLNIKRLGAADADGIVAFGQNITPGTKVPMGTVVEVNFGDRSIQD